jgi:hypothetical protein
MIRILYRSLIRLHPPEFNERFAEEMLWIFDECDRKEHLGLLGDGFVSLLRQWSMGSGIWKFAIGAAASGLLMSSCWYSLQIAFANAIRRGNPGHFAEAQHRILAAERSPRFAVAAQSRAATDRDSNQALIRPIEVSPSIVILKEQLASGNHEVLETFWQGATKVGTPLLNHTKERTRAVIATFVWRGDRNTENVGMLAPLANSPGLPVLPLAYLPGTDVW